MKSRHSELPDIQRPPPDGTRLPPPGGGEAPFRTPPHTHAVATLPVAPAANTASGESCAQACTDSLTGLVNRRGMEHVLDREIARAHWGKTALSVAILGVDHFSQLNGAHGQAVGDRVLVRLADTIRRALRDADAVCRYGGGEFAVILPDSAPDGARLVVERLRISIEKTGHPESFGVLDLRISAGVAELEVGEGRDNLLRRAERALHAAKRAGRNRVMLAQAAA